MAFTSRRISIAGRTIRIADGTYGAGAVGKSQTINVCDRSNRFGDYEQVYRIQDVENFVTPEELLQNASTLTQLDSYVIRRGFTAEGGRRR